MSVSRDGAGAPDNADDDAAPEVIVTGDDPPGEAAAVLREPAAEPPPQAPEGPPEPPGEATAAPREPAAEPPPQAPEGPPEPPGEATAAPVARSAPAPVEGDQVGGAMIFEWLAAVFGIPAVFVSVLEISTQAKIIWLAILFFDSCLVVFTIMRLPRVPRRSRRYALATVTFFVLVLTAVLGGRAANAWTQAALESQCLPAGMGNSAYESAFFNAYHDPARGGGAKRLGCAVGPVVELFGGYHQDLRGGTEESGVIMATTPGEAHLLTGRAYAAYLRIGNGDGVRSTFLAGFAMDDARKLEGGTVQPLGGDRWEASALLGREGEDLHWVPPDLWGWFRDKAAPHQTGLGYPTGDFRAWNDGIRQDFEHGWLWYRADVGVRTGDGGQDPAVGTAQPPKPTPLPAKELTYMVECVADVPDGDVPHEITPGGSVSQLFRAKLPFIEELGALVDIDPRRAPAAGATLSFELLDSDGRRVMKPIKGPLSPAGLSIVVVDKVAVTPGALYYVRVVNTSSKTLGFHLSAPGRENTVAEPNEKAVVEGELPRPERHEDPVGALCGRVVATT